MNSRRLIISGVVLVALLVGVAYFYFQGKEYVFRFSEAELRQALAQRVPVRRTYFLIFQLTLDNPRVTLIEGSDRVNAGLDVTLNVRIQGESLPLGGSIDASGGMRYDSQTGEFFLTDPVIEQLRVDGVPAEFENRVTSVMTKALGEFYSRRPVYTLSALDAKQAAARLVLKSVVVTNQELVVTLGVGAQ